MKNIDDNKVNRNNAKKNGHIDPQPGHGNDEHGHNGNNGNGNGWEKPPRKSHSVAVWNGRI